MLSATLPVFSTGDGPVFEWRSIRTFFTVLLLLPLLHVGWRLSHEFRDYLDPSPTTWAAEMQAIVSADQYLTLPRDPVLVVGGRRVALWQDLPRLLEPHPTLLRGLGDATIEDVTHYYPRLIGHYRPSVLVLMPSYADLHLRDAKRADDLVAAVRDLVALNARHLAGARSYIFTPLKTPLHPADDERIDAMAQALRTWAREQADVRILDANALLTQADGRPNPAFYAGDGINLNTDGYLRCGMLLREALQQLPAP